MKILKVPETPPQRPRHIFSLVACGKWVVVYLHPTVTALRRHFLWSRRFDKDCSDRSFAASAAGVCVSGCAILQLTRSKPGAPRRWRNNRVAACVYLADSYMGVGYVAHELLHAALGLARARGLVKKLNKIDPKVPYASDPEETLCAIHETLVKQFWQKWHRYAGKRPQGKAVPGRSRAKRRKHERS